MKIYKKFKPILISIFFLIVSCSTIIPDIYFYPITDNWNISDNIDNSCMLKKKEMNWRSKYFIPYLLNKDQFNFLLSETENISKEDENSLYKHEHCTYKYYILIENYEDNTGSLLENFEITMENTSFYYSKNFKFLYYYDNLIFKTSPISIDFFSNPKRTIRLKYGKDYKLYNSDTDITTERKFIIFCSEKKIHTLNLSIISKKENKYYSTYSIASDCVN
jgi:hypothetical protein